jgi:hypothetical protein
MLDAGMRNRLEAALRADNLKGLVDQLRADGFGQAEVYARFEAFYRELGGAGRAADEEVVGGALDRI